jgi:hypothetical protein
MKSVLNVFAAIVLLASSASDGLALRQVDRPNSGTCMGGPRDGQRVGNLRRCGNAGRPSGGARHAAIEKCKQSVGRPNFRACMQSGGSQSGCKSQTVPKVKACVGATLGF